MTKAGINWLSTIHRTITVIKVNLYVSEIFIKFSGQAQYWNSLIKFIYWLTTANTGCVSYYIPMTALHPCLKLHLSHWFQVGLSTKNYIYIDATLENKERNRRKAPFFFFSPHRSVSSHDKGCALPKTTLSLMFAKLVGRTTSMDATAALYMKPLIPVCN